MPCKLRKNVKKKIKLTLGELPVCPKRRKMIFGSYVIFMREISCYKLLEILLNPTWKEDKGNQVSNNVNNMYVQLFSSAMGNSCST